MLRDDRSILQEELKLQKMSVNPELPIRKKN